MRASDVERSLRDLGCDVVRQRGSHRRWRSACGRCFTTIPYHRGEDLKPGTVRSIERDMEPCLGARWLRK